VLKKLADFRMIVVTEHQPGPKVRAIPNKDKPHGDDTRVYDNSGVYLDRPPFNLSSVEIILETKLSGSNIAYSSEEVLRSFLIRN
jgi:hypothetical protein